MTKGRDLLDAAAALNALATGERFELDDRGRARAGFLAAVVQLTAYARPFTRSYGWPKIPPELITYERAEEDLHKQIISLRHKVYAHSDSDSHSVRPRSGSFVIVREPPLRLTAAEATLFQVMTAKIIKSMRGRMEVDNGLATAVRCLSVSNHTARSVNPGYRCGAGPPIEPHRTNGRPPASSKGGGLFADDAVKIIYLPFFDGVSTLIGGGSSTARGSFGF
jgi:hypothetical protein